MIRDNRRLPTPDQASFSSPFKSLEETHLPERVNSFELFRRRNGVPKVDFNVVRDVEFL